MREATDASAITSSLADLAAQASALRAQAEVAMNTSPEKASQYLQAALKLSERTSDPKTEAMILNDQGVAVQDSESPFEIFHRALDIEDRIHDCREKFATLTSLTVSSKTLRVSQSSLAAASNRCDQKHRPC